jgi:hypothetical protein
MAREKYFGDDKGPEYIDPKDGFHFETNSYGELVLSSTNNHNYSAIVSMDPEEVAKLRKPGQGQGLPRALADRIKQGGNETWNEFGGKVTYADKTIRCTIQHIHNNRKRTRIAEDIHVIKTALSQLKKYGVTDDFKLTAIQSPFKNMTVGEVLGMPDSNFVYNMANATTAAMRKHIKNVNKNGKSRVVKDMDSFTELANKTDLDWPDRYWHAQDITTNSYWFGGKMESLHGDEDGEILSLKDHAKLFSKLLLRHIAKLQDEGIDVVFPPDGTRRMQQAMHPDWVSLTGEDLKERKTEKLEQMKEDMTKFFNGIEDDAKKIELNLLLTYLGITI